MLSENFTLSDCENDDTVEIDPDWDLEFDAPQCCDLQQAHLFPEPTSEEELYLDEWFRHQPEDSDQEQPHCLLVEEEEEENQEEDDKDDQNEELIQMVQSFLQDFQSSTNSLSKPSLTDPARRLKPQRLPVSTSAAATHNHHVHRFITQRHPTTVPTRKSAHPSKPTSSELTQRKREARDRDAVLHKIEQFNRQQRQQKQHNPLPQVQKPAAVSRPATNMKRHLKTQLTLDRQADELLRLLSEHNRKVKQKGGESCAT